MNDLTKSFWKKWGPGRLLTRAVVLSALISLGFCAQTVADTAAEPAQPKLSAKWIWKPQSAQGEVPAYRGYNQTILLTRNAVIPSFEKAMLYITADSWYRLSINDTWVADGPCRAWPEHYQYDELDVTQYLKPNAENRISIIARYFGVGTFHVIPQQAGALAQLDLDGKTFLGTDGTWMTADLPQWISNTPKASIQMEACEWYDARLETRGNFTPAAELFPADGGPWKDLNPRDVALFSRTPMFFKSFMGASVVKSEGLNFCIQPTQQNYPGMIEASHTTSMAGGMITVLENKEACDIDLHTGDIRGAERLRISVDGVERSGKMKLEAGKHLICTFSAGIAGHDREKTLRFRGNTEGFKLVNPLEANFENPWTYIHLPECYYATNDYTRPLPDVDRKNRLYSETIAQMLKIKTAEEFVAGAKERLRNYPSSQMLLQDFYWPFYDKAVLEADARALVKNPAGLIHNNALPTIVYPDPRGDVELAYDLGEQSCGYYSFRMKAPAGTVLDIVQLEYISQGGEIQIPRENRNGMRYIAKEGVNEMVSLKRRSGRYIYLTLRQMSGPVEIQNFHLIESTYPVDYQGSFACSDARLSQIWDISTRTLKLCMEDTYTDCPLYEQTHWVGDARNESLFGYGVFGAEDLARRCINITAQSLEHYPFAGCQTPSCWDTLLPAWSFLWGISVWDYYWQTGDKEFVKEYFPAVMQNLRGTAAYINQDNLFSGPFWNMFDWSGADQGPNTVTHNSMFMVGAIDAALNLSNAIGGTPDDKWLRVTRGRLVGAINKLWDENKKSYPDSIHNDGKISPSICQHTSFLSLLYDIAEPQNREALINNVLNPPDNMVKIGSPFAVLYLYETLEKFGHQDVIIEQIYKNYLPMLEVGSTTVWESFPGGTTIPKFPTRSHCHAWSSAPSRFLPRVILGIVPTSPGAATVELSPRIYDLTWAEGGVLTTRGVVSVRWKIEANKVLNITFKAPEGVQVEFKSNPTLAGFDTIMLNGQQVK
jgi:hypothetical protein